MISLEYYEKVFDNKPAKLVEVKRLILNDFKKMEDAFFAADKERDIKSMRAELHKMSPIVSNLKYAELISLFEKYRVFETYQDSLQELNRELKFHLSEIYNFIQ